jgi:hypothetical protein
MTNETNPQASEAIIIEHARRDPASALLTRITASLESAAEYVSSGDFPETTHQELLDTFALCEATNSSLGLSLPYDDPEITGDIVHDCRRIRIALPDLRR